MLNEDYKEMLQRLLDAGVEFLLVGAYALAAHGHPRATGDIDIWVCPSPENAHRVYTVLAAFGAPLQAVTPQDFSHPDVVFQIGVAPRRIDIMTGISGLEFAEAARNAAQVEIEALAIPVLSRTDLITNKEASGRERDLLDAKILRQHEE